MLNLITKRPWLVGISAMTVAFMVVAFSVVMMQTRTVAANDGPGGAGNSASGGLIDMMVMSETDVDNNIFADADSAYAEVLWANIQVANDKDLVIAVSLETGLYTDTTVKSKGGKQDTSMAYGGIKGSVIVESMDGGPVHKYAYPSEVVFDSRRQTMSATFQGLIEDCVQDDGTLVLTDDCLEPEEVRLVLDTMGAHSFNFLLGNLPSGDYRVSLWATLDTEAEAQTGHAKAKAILGHGTMVVNEVRWENHTSAYETAP